MSVHAYISEEYFSVWVPLIAASQTWFRGWIELVEQNFYNLIVSAKCRRLQPGDEIQTECNMQITE